MKVGVKIVLDHPDAKIPVYAKLGDAGADVVAVSCGSTMEEINSILGVGSCCDEKRRIVSAEEGDYVIPAGGTTLVKLGFRIELPDGWEMQVRSRSGMALRGLCVANSPGTIDSGYRGECMVIIQNTSNLCRVIKPGTRVAQFVLKEAPQAKFEQTLTLSDTSRGEGGFGSTGTK